MKATIRIPTEQYAFVEIEDEFETREDVRTAYDEINAEYKGGDGLPMKEWNAALDQYLSKGTGESDTYMRMSKYQQNIIQEIKRAFKRINK